MSNKTILTSQYGINLIKRFEGFSAAPYICAGGKATIGYGHVILQGENYKYITEFEAEEILKSDLSKSEASILRNISVTLLQNQFDALVSLVFNIGGAAFQRSTLRQKINSTCVDEDVAHEFMRWIYAGGNILSGLIKRRAAEVELYITL